MTADEWEKIQPGLRNQIDRLCNNAPGSGTERLEHGRAKVDWRLVLRKYVRQAVSVEPTFQRPSRRFPTLTGIIPGKVHRARAKVMAVIDTSGSIDNAVLSQISAELRLMVGTHEVVVLECDAAIQAIYPLRGEITSVSGRGGTDLRPPFESDILKKIHPDAIVYFTDGMGLAPPCPPRIPVIWCLTPGGQQPAPWGRAIFLA